jgi:hypothetical protein
VCAFLSAYVKALRRQEPLASLLQVTLLLLEDLLRCLKMHLCNASQYVSARLSNKLSANANNSRIGGSLRKWQLHVAGKSFQVLKKCCSRQD